MTQFTVQTQIVGDQGWIFAQRASDISKTLQWWESTMSVLGDYIGTDSAGTQFKARYDPVLGTVEPAMRSLIQELYGLGTTLDQLARQSTEHDAANGRAIHRTTGG